MCLEQYIIFTTYNNHVDVFSKIICMMFLYVHFSGARMVLLPRAPLASRCYSHSKVETDEEFDARWVTYFSKPDIDAWELKKGMNTLIGYDLVPEPKIVDSALRACRRLNDLASAIRILEAVKDKSGPHKDIYPYLIQELKPTLTELGISTPEELGMDKL
uniref:Cytochrome c oxidase subunit 5A, mitochondrial n=1 Tax=Esox lucius TaxID=8010 RepID=A0A3P9A8C8_ESOLU